MTSLGANRFLIARRLVQTAVMVLLIGGNLWGWTVLRGNLSSSVVLGVAPLADPFAVLQLLVAGGLLAADVLIGAAITLVFYALLGGRTFCAWVCPMNAVTDLANRLGRRFRTGSGSRRVFGRPARYFILAVALILSAALGTAAFEAVSPIGMLQRGLVFGMGAGWLAVAAVFLFDLLVQKNGFCGHVCPLGAFYALVGRTALLRIDHDHEQCTSCMDCLEVCPENRILDLVGQASGSVLDGVCTNCGRCIEVCPDDALSFSHRKQAMSLESGGS
ncbi:MAG: quinol dehydrogenase ferredoxin subunit NapH [Candidatus Krumholzibacteriota bacterium]